ncbi:unnamed protein product [Cladocopium goreaui]|uniref:Flagellar radial spoke protein 1 n=1 Tax=Cladocopium goreaui TaxID=2562237 RepID=A0A9P1FLK9_9DINO|nr:unnamed protein product [Cladocopium goreaui]
MGSKRCFRNGGDVYFGEVQELEDGSCLRHGFGHQIFTAKAAETGEEVIYGQYKGSWRADLQTSGIFGWSDGTVYEGFFVEGRPHGHGRMKWPEGSVYDGNWQRGELHGQGTYICGFKHVESHGIFWRNCLRDHNGQWVNKVKQREELRSQHLRINAYPASKFVIPVYRCSSREILDRALAASQEPPYLIPFLLATHSCSSGRAPPLDFVEGGDLGCKVDTTVHLGYAAQEKLRARDTDVLFQKAMAAALRTARPLTLIWGDDEPGPSGEAPPMDVWDLDNSQPVPDKWALTNFLSPLVLPADIFDLRHFQCAGLADFFLHRDANDAVPEVPDVEPAHPAMQPAPILYSLKVLLMSLKRVPNEFEDESIRRHLLGRFGLALPVHRIAAFVACDM